MSFYQGENLRQSCNIHIVECVVNGLGRDAHESSLLFEASDELDGGGGGGGGLLAPWQVVRCLAVSL